MSHQLSPDGKWVWDGHQWRPRPKWWRRPGWVVLVAGLVACLVVATFAVPVASYLIRVNGSGAPAAEPAATQTGSPERSRQPRQQVPETIRPGEEVTKERLAQVSPSEFYWELLERQMTRPISLITSTYFAKPQDFEQHKSYYVNQLGIDRRTGEFTAAKTSYQEGRTSTMNRCVDGKYYYWSSYDEEWSHLQSSDQDCAEIPTLMHSASTDGVVTSGLSGKQADKVVAALRDEFDGFAHPGIPVLITIDGKTYVRQVVDYTPLKLEDGRYWGTMIFTLAFKETGLDPETWPWYTGLGPGEGLHVVYYIDPHTLLPVASVMRSTPVLDDQGKEKVRYDQTMAFNYQFPAKLPEQTLKGAKPLTLTLPEGWRITK